MSGLDIFTFTPRTNLFFEIAVCIFLVKISSKSKKNGIDPKITVKIWTAMIKAYIDYEFRNFKK